MLEKQLNQAILREGQSLERESFYQEKIEAMQRLLEAPKTMTTFTDQIFPDIATDPPSKSKSNYDELTTTEQAENKRIPVPEHAESEPKKRGWLSLFFLPNG